MASRFPQSWGPAFAPFRFQPTQPSTSQVRNSIPVLTFQGCGCTYTETILEHAPLHCSRYLHTKYLPTPAPALHQCSFSTANQHQHQHSPPPRRKIHLSRNCRIHEFAQFIEVHDHIVQTEYPRLLENADIKGDKAECERIREDCTSRLRAMAGNLMGMWDVEVSFGEALRFSWGAGTAGHGGDGKSGFTDEERRLHGSQMREVFQHRPTKEGGLVLSIGVWRKGRELGWAYRKPLS